MRKVESDHGVACDKCGYITHTIYLRDKGTQGVECLCEDCTTEVMDYIEDD